jgi:DNA-binding CsgD family transcriptional regulator
LEFPDIGLWTKQSEQRLTTVDAAGAIFDVASLRRWIQAEVRMFIPHRSAVVGIGHSSMGSWRIERALNIDLPDLYLAEAQSSDDAPASPLISKWLETGRAQVIDAHDIVSPHLFAWRERAMRFGVRVALLHGHGPGVNGQFVFIKLFDPMQPLNEAATRLERLMPTVLGAWRNVLQHEQAARKDESIGTSVSRARRFTPKERELLLFIKLAKTNSEIAQILGKSEKTVKTQISMMLRKAGVPNRVALAASMY